MGFTGFLLGFTGLQWIEQGVMEFPWVWMGVTGFLLGFIVFQREKIIKKILIELFEDQHPPLQKKPQKFIYFLFS